MNRHDRHSDQQMIKGKGSEHLKEEGKATGENYRTNSDETLHQHTHSSHYRKRNSAIAVSIITCVFMGVLAYEFLAQDSQSDRKRESFLQYVSENRENESGQKLFLRGSENILDGHEESLRVLEKLSEDQAQEINELRNALAARSENNWEIKANLFKQESDPKERAKIAKLSQSLSEKEREHSDSLLKIRSTEKENSDLHKKITQLEVTRDALVATIESHRTNKEQEHAELKAKISNLTAQSERDKKALQQKVTLLETAQKELIESLEKKTQQLQSAKRMLRAQKNELSDEAKRLSSLSEDYRSSERTLKIQLLELVYQIEFEAMMNRIKERWTIIDTDAAILNAISPYQLKATTEKTDKDLMARRSYYRLLDYFTTTENAMLSTLELIDRQEQEVEHGKLMLESSNLKALILKEELNLYRAKLNQKTSGYIARDDEENMDE